MAKHVRAFISYSHKDDDLRERLRAHLSQLERDELVEAWDDRAIPAGDQWADEIDQRLEQADIILLLVSADFIRSDYCYKKEMSRALERHAAKDDRAIVIPVILRACDWQSAPFAKLQALPRDGRPLADWKSEDDYFAVVAKGLRTRIQTLVEPGQSWLTRIGVRLRDPAWWQRPVVLGAAVVIVAALAVTVSWWQNASHEVEQAIRQGTSLLRVGSYVDAQAALEPACSRWVVGRPACFVREKAKLGAMLESQGGSLEVERFAQRLEMLKSQHPGDDPDLLLFEGGLALHVRDPRKRQEQVEQARAAFRLARERDPRFAEAFYYEASVYLMSARTDGDYKHAHDLLNQAIQIEPHASHYLNARAYVRHRLGDLTGAVADYRQSADDGSVMSHLELAEMLWLVGRFNDAVDQQETAVKKIMQEVVNSGRNTLPWVLELAPGRQLVLRAKEEKACYARLALQASQVLLGRDVQPDTTGCGAHGSEIARAVAVSLERATGEGLKKEAVSRATAFAKQLRG